jgi:hypothetical protein
MSGIAKRIGKNRRIDNRKIENRKVENSSSENSSSENRNLKSPFERPAC